MKVFNLIATLLLLIVCLSSASPIKLTTSNFDSQIATGKWFIKFFAPWCGHCKALAPTWDSLSNDAPTGVNIAHVDCTTDPELCKKHQVRGYPTLQFFKNGAMVSNYEGGRTLQDLSNFAKTQADVVAVDKKEEVNRSTSLVGPIPVFGVFAVGMMFVFYLMHTKHSRDPTESHLIKTTL
ncbi:thioredoxin domain-containing protein [Acrasis kona]|uniref:Thioredoxin domain-containing protein n=1 Tax=Acrasis kona TaxID=1008807 RepID=A0AAW2Z6K3_9EUKA